MEPLFINPLYQKLHILKGCQNPFSTRKILRGSILFSLAHKKTRLAAGHNRRQVTLPSCRAQRRSGAMTVTGNPRAAATYRWLTPSPYEVRDDSGRHNDPSDKDRFAHNGSGKSAACLG